MSTDNDYVPGGNLEFFNWQSDLITYATTRRVGWGIADDPWTALIDAQTTYNPLFNAIKNKGTRTSAQVEAHTNGRTVYEKIVRDFVQEWLAFNSLVTDADRVSMNITVHTDERSPRPAIETAPNPSMKPKDGARILCECRVESDSSKPSMHPDADSIEMRFAIGTAAPALPKDCPNIKLKSKARFTIELDLADAGKKIFAFFRYINTSDDTKNGPWSTISSSSITD